MNNRKCNCPIHKTEMKFIEDVENKYHPGVISHSKYKCTQCKYHWSINGFDEMWSSAPPRKVKFNKNPEIGDCYNDIIKPIES